MTDKAEIRELREKVEAGQIAPSDFELMASAVFDRRTLRFATSAELGSLDAALALHEAVLPDWLVHGIEQDSRKEWYVTICHISTGGTQPIQGKWQHTGGPNLARAWLIAILKAMEETE